MKNNPENFILHAALIEGIGPVAIERIMSAKHANVSWSDLYAWRSEDWQAHFGFSHAVATKLVEGLADQKLIDTELAQIEKQRIEVVTPFSENYPILLRALAAPPPVLYVRGTLACHDRTLALVGSRKAQSYARNIVNRLVPGLVQADWTIVSGGAIGADSMAHQAVVHHGGKTIAIVGSGLAHPYPRTNWALFDKIVETGGALVSIFPVQAAAMPGNFPARNRIISGMSKGCVVIQAAEKSGASITAQYALDQSREVFAVPGPIDDELSAGCHRLIQQGAKLVTSVDDILVEFGYKPQAPIATHHDATQQLSVVTKQSPTASVAPQKVVFDHALFNSADADANTFNRELVTLCAQSSFVDDLMSQTGREMMTVQMALFDLQLAGLVCQDSVGRWQVVAG